MRPNTSPDALAQRRRVELAHHAFEDFVFETLVILGQPALRARCGHSDSGFPRGLICDSLCPWQMLGVIDGPATAR